MALPRVFIVSAWTCLDCTAEWHSAAPPIDDRRERAEPVANRRYGRVTLCATKSFFALMAMLLTSCVCPDQTIPRMERIVLSADGKSFVFAQSEKSFRPWGVNYGNNGRLMEDFWDTDWQTLADDFQEIKQMGANVVRVHLQFSRFMEAPGRPNAAALKQLRRMLTLAETT